MMVRLREASRPREGMSLAQLLHEFAHDEAAAEAWFVDRRWPEVVRCAHCDSERVADFANRRPMSFWCRDCRRYFSVNTHSIMH